MKRVYLYLLIVLAVLGFGIYFIYSKSSVETQNSSVLQPIYIVGQINSPTGYEKDNSNVYYLGDVVAEADPKTFTLFPAVNESYGKDANHVYFGTTTVLGADPNIFSASDIYGKDAQAVYRAGVVIPGADGKTFTDLNENYSKDATHVFYQNNIMVGADPQTIELLSDYEYAKDKNHVYNWGQIMTGVNPATFIPPTPG